MSTLDELLDEFEGMRVDGRRPSTADVVAAIVHLEPRQAEAMALVLWALPLELVGYYVRKGDVATLARREGYPIRVAARQIGVSHEAIRRLLARAKPNILAWLLPPVAG